MNNLTQQEEEVMLYIWELDEFVVKDIVAKYPEPQPPYTTVASETQRLCIGQALWQHGCIQAAHQTKRIQAEIYGRCRP